MDAGEVRFRDLHLRFYAGGIERLADDALDALAHLRVVFLARHEDQAGIVTPEGVATQQQAHPRPLLQPEDARHQTDQIRHAGLEQLVPREGFQDVLQRLAVMAVGRQREVLHDLRDLVTHQRNFAGCAVIGGGGPQSDKAALADQPAAGIEVLHADVIEVAGAMHRRLQVGLGDEHQVARAALAADVARKGPRGAGGRLWPVRRTPSPDSSTGSSAASALAAAQPVFLDSRGR